MGDAHQLHHMRLHTNEITDVQEIEAILGNGKYAVIAMCRENEPYIVTLSCGYDRENDALYFHSAATGLKLEIIRSNPRVCATVIEDNGYQDGNCAHSYRSVVLYGELSAVTETAEREHGIRCMLCQLEQNPDALADKYLQSEKFLRGTTILKLAVYAKRGKSGQ
jgi:nitroimidazol reductase NimA-like FMN-containing flavoprotein (pyridoxamine 5'-phosphate oxidase superfamily)